MDLEGCEMTKDEAVILLCEHFSEGMVRTIVDAIAKDEALEKKDEPVAMRYDFDGYGYKYIDNGSGSDWQTRIKDAEPLYTTPQRTWVWLTKEEINKGLLRSFYVLEKARAWRDGVAWAMQQLKDKNNV